MRANQCHSAFAKRSTERSEGCAPVHFEGGTAVVTGAASGIGAALAAGLAARGSHLVLLDRDADGLAAVAAAARAVPTGVGVTEHVADLADPAAARGGRRGRSPRTVPTPHC